jgi:phytoene synthase
MTAGERTLRAGSKSFALAARLLPRPIRVDVAALYAYLRYVDDTVDLAPPAAQLGHVERLERELDAILSGKPQSVPVLAAFQELVRRHRIPPIYPRELLAGMRMDAAGTTYESLEDLLRYAYRVAGTVGLMCCHVFGVESGRALAPAAHLGIAMQLTNVCRDVAEDLARGRLYLPRTLLGEPLFAVLETLGPGTPSPDVAAALAPTLDAVLRCADRYYASADAGMSALGFRVAVAVRAARFVYAGIGDELRRRHLDVCAGRAVVAPATKARLLGRALMFSAREAPSRARRRVLRHALPDTRSFDDVLLA